ncbi:MAG: hypothetical protein ACI3XP_08065 [Eubacteriales bacterium]
MKNPTEKMLHELYEYARCGCEAINGILPKITDSALLAETTAQLEMYSSLGESARRLLADKSLADASFPLKDKLTVRGGVIMETMGISDQRELARILRVSSRDSANRMRSTIADMSGSGCDADALALGQRMMAYAIAETERLGTLQCE